MGHECICACLGKNQQEGREKERILKVEKDRSTLNIYI
jgi:hypothetical protein